MIKALCRVCNQMVPSDQFKLHHTYKQMVCLSCYTGKTQKKKEDDERKIIQEKQKPKGWDQEDEYLNRLSRINKDEIKNQFTKIPGTDHVKCKCTGCKYEFRYDPFHKKPRSCPYCDADIPRMRTFNLL
ncbi:hypothetical protein COV12_03010 [Candidatus Woesearchaeota archaeon CG10_big_fil_rev_8_21_14_0_10_32_24]|nr:MAG: hypothetical protein COV12_03010 [Candidatus Woesearchaeota archaeon CG10_big_fil_rev_8_21_14_0_10_32_24]